MSNYENKVTPRIALECLHHEAIVRQAYKDTRGTWTWSGGLTAMSGHNVNRYIGKPAPLEKCLAVYCWALENYADAVRAEFDGVPLTEEQFGAALSFHWNTGAIRSASWPDSFKAGKIDRARTEFMAWKKPPEILERRAAERNLFFDGKWSGDGWTTEYTKVTSAYTTVRSSAVRINVAAQVEALLTPLDYAEPITAVDHAAQVDAIAVKLVAIADELKRIF